MTITIRSGLAGGSLTGPGLGPMIISPPLRPAQPSAGTGPTMDHVHQALRVRRAVKTSHGAKQSFSVPSYMSMLPALPISPFSGGRSSVSKSPRDAVHKQVKAYTGLDFHAVTHSEPQPPGPPIGGTYPPPTTDEPSGPTPSPSVDMGKASTGSATTADGTMPAPATPPTGPVMLGADAGMLPPIAKKSWVSEHWTWLVAGAVGVGVAWWVFRK